MSAERWGGEVPERLFGSLWKAHHAPEVSDEADSEDYLTLPDESEETEQAMASTRIAYDGPCLLDGTEPLATCSPAFAH